MTVHPTNARCGVLLLAGGAATRLPGKLTRDAGGTPLILRAFQRVAPGRETVVSCAGGFSAQIDTGLCAPLVLDRWPLRGPLGGLVSTMAQMHSRFIVALGADMPLTGEWLIETLERARQEGDEAVVPVRDTEEGPRLEPLAALYDRFAFLTHAYRQLRRSGSVVSVVRQLKTRTVRVANPLLLRSVNTEADYAAFCAQFEA